MVLVGAAVGCADSDAAAPLETPPSTVARGNRDGELRLGALLPLEGERATMGVSMVSGVEMAVRDINAAGGVGGRPVVVVGADEGDGGEAATVALDSLLVGERVDAVIGPATSRAALAVRDQLRRAEAPSCSPAATAAALTEDVDGAWFARTIGSDVLEGIAVGQVIADAGRRSVAVLAPDDDYGSAMSETIRTELVRRDATVASVRYRADALDLSGPVADALAGSPDAIAVVGLPDAGGRLLAALGRAGVTAGAGEGQTLVVVTDGLRVPNLSEKVEPSRPSAAAGVWGVAPATIPAAEGAGFASALDAFAPAVAPDYAAYAYDCTVLLALAASAAGGEGQADALPLALVAVSGGGERCEDFAACAAALAEGRDIDYVGVAGQIDLTSSGDADRGVYDVFEFTDDGSTSLKARTVIRLP